MRNHSELAGEKAHVPYRNSKLTRILQESLGGNSKTLLLVASSPEEGDASETHSTLLFASRAKTIQTVAVVNTILPPEPPPDPRQTELSETNEQLRAELAEAHAKLAQLRSDCGGGDCGGGGGGYSGGRGGSGSSDDWGVGGAAAPESRYGWSEAAEAAAAAAAAAAEAAAAEAAEGAAQLGQQLAAADARADDLQQRLEESEHDLVALQAVGRSHEAEAEELQAEAEELRARLEEAMRARAGEEGEMRARLEEAEGRREAEAAELQRIRGELQRLRRPRRVAPGRGSLHGDVAAALRELEEEADTARRRGGRDDALQSTVAELRLQLSEQRRRALPPPGGEGRDGTGSRACPQVAVPARSGSSGPKTKGDADADTPSPSPFAGGRRPRWRSCAGSSSSPFRRPRTPRRGTCGQRPSTRSQRRRSRRPLAAATHGGGGYSSELAGAPSPTAAPPAQSPRPRAICGRARGRCRGSCESCTT